MVDLAQRLWDARRGGTLVEAAARRELGDLEDAYRVQDEAVRASGHARTGWKVGSTSAEARRKLGTDRPGAGALLEPFCFERGAEVPVFAAHSPAVEGEFVFVMGEGLPPREAPFERAEVLAAVMGVAGGIEVVGSRFEGGLAGLGREGVTADFGANIAFVAGEIRPDWRTGTCADAGVALSVDGEALAQGTGALALGRSGSGASVARQPLTRTGRRAARRRPCDHRHLHRRRRDCSRCARPGGFRPARAGGLHGRAGVRARRLPRFPRREGYS